MLVRAGEQRNTSKSHSLENKREKTVLSRKAAEGCSSALRGSLLVPSSPGSDTSQAPTGHVGGGKLLKTEHREESGAAEPVSPGLVPLAGVWSLNGSQEAELVIRRKEAPGHARQPGLQLSRLPEVPRVGEPPVQLG